jgi:hypothetical protein
MLDVVDRVAGGKIRRDAAVVILELAFNMPRDKAEKILGAVGVTV